MPELPKLPNSNPYKDFKNDELRRRALFAYEAWKSLRCLILASTLFGAVALTGKLPSLALVAKFLPTG
ncbi:hypothetical protein [Polaromonas sp.]|uniref:hypothetical protein n=1 Tax=Polaromonas sp. TaxID=1869339 RepID=UPI003267DD0E